MPTQHEVWTVADRLRARPARVSIRAVIAALPRGGSFREVGKHLRGWKAERSYLPGVELSGLPEALQGAVASVGLRIWDAAMVDATRRFEADRERHERLLSIERSLADEALGHAEVWEARASAAAREVEKLRSELATAREAARGLKRKLRAVRPAGEGAEERKRAERRAASAFWARVVEEVAACLADVGPRGLTRDEIWHRLSDDVKREGLERGEDFAPANLSKRLDERVLRKRFFERDGDRYRRLSAAAGARARPVLGGGGEVPSA